MTATEEAKWCQYAALSDRSETSGCSTGQQSSSWIMADFLKNMAVASIRIGAWSHRPNNTNGLKLQKSTDGSAWGGGGSQNNDGTAWMDVLTVEGLSSATKLKDFLIPKGKDLARYWRLVCPGTSAACQGYASVGTWIFSFKKLDPPAPDTPVVSVEGKQLRVSWKFPAYDLRPTEICVGLRKKGMNDVYYVDSSRANKLVRTRSQMGAAVQYPATSVLIPGVELSAEYHAMVNMLIDGVWHTWSPESAAVKIKVHCAGLHCKMCITIA